MPTYLIHGGHVLSMDCGVGDYPRGDVLVRDGVIVAVGEDLDARLILRQPHNAASRTAVWRRLALTEH